MGGYNNAILQALQFVGNLKQNREQKALEQQRTADERKYRQDEIDFRHKQLDQEHEQWLANHELQEKAANLSNLAAKSQIADIINKGGSIPGDVITGNYPGIPGTGGAFPGVGPAPNVLNTVPSTTNVPTGVGTLQLPSTVQAPQSYTHTISDEKGNPILTLSNMPSSQDYATQQAALETIRRGPEKAEKEEEAQFAAGLTRDTQAQLENLRYQHELNQAAYANANSIASQKRAEDFQIKLHEDEGKMRLAGDYINQMGEVPPFARQLLGVNADGNVSSYSAPGVTNEEFNDLSTRVATGQVSSQDLKNLYPKLGQRNAVLKKLRDRGLEPVDAKVTSSINGLVRLNDELNQSRRAADLATNNWIQMQYESSPAKQEYNGIVNSIRANVPFVAKDQSGVARFNNPELMRYDGYLVPKIDFLPGMFGTAKKQYDEQIGQFTNAIQREVNVDLAKVPDKQKPYIIHYLESNGVTFAGKPPEGHSNNNPAPAGGVVPKIPGSRLLKQQTFNYNKPEDLSGKIPDAKIGTINIIRNGRIMTNVPMGQATDEDEIIPNKEK